MEKVRCKFACNSINKLLGSTKVSFNAVGGKDGENADFTRATPLGNLEVSIQDGAPASEFFEVGEYYYLDLVKAPKN